MDKYIGILERLVRCGEIERDIIDLLAQELYALRYDIASELYDEWLNQRSTKWGIPEDFFDWLSDQGEAITIGKEDK